MKWKDTGEMEEKDTTTEEEEYFDEPKLKTFIEKYKVLGEFCIIFHLIIHFSK